MQPSDDALIEAHRAGDPRAFEELVRRHGDRLLGFLLRLGRDRHEAEDQFQETFRRVHERADSYRGGGRFAGWLYAIAANVARDGVRRRQRAKKVLSLDGPAAQLAGAADSAGAVLEDHRAAPPWRRIAQDEQRQQVRRALAELPERQRTTLVLAYYQGLSYAEVAGVLGCSIGTVKTQMYRAVRALAKRLPAPQTRTS